MEIHKTKFMGKNRTIFEAARDIVRRENFTFKTKPKIAMTEPIKTALDLAKSLPCQCSDCGMNEPASGEMIEIYVTERVAAERERIKELMGELIKVAELRYESYKESEDVIERAKKLIDSL